MKCKLLITISIIALFSGCGQNKPDTDPNQLQTEVVEDAINVNNSSLDTTNQGNSELKSENAVLQYSCTYNEGTLEITGYKIPLTKDSYSLYEKQKTKIFYNENIDCYKFNNNNFVFSVYSGTNTQVCNIYYDFLYTEYKDSLKKPEEIETSISVDKYTYCNKDYVCYYTLVDNKKLYGLMMLRNELTDPTKDVGLFCFTLRNNDNTEIKSNEICETLSKILADSTARIVGTLDITYSLEESGYIDLFKDMDNQLSSEYKETLKKGTF